MTPTASATTTFSTMIHGLDASHVIAASSVAYTKAILGTFPAIATSSLTASVGYGHTASPGSTSYSSTTQSEHMTHIAFTFASTYSLPPVPAALDACFIWATSSANQEGYVACPSKSDSAPEPEPPRPMSTHPSVSSVADEATTGSEGCRHQEKCFTIHSGASMSAHTWHEPPTPPQPTVSTSVASATVTTETTRSGSFLTTMSSQSAGPGSHVPDPTTSSNLSPNNTSASSSQLPLILSLTLGVLAIVALGMIVVRRHARRRSKAMLSIALSNDSGTSQEEKDSTMKGTSWVTGVTLSRPTTSYRASTYMLGHVIPYIESYQTSNGELSDPFADSSDMVSSRTSIHPASIHSVDSLSANIAFTTPVNSNTWDVTEAPGNLIEASTSSLELHFAAPLVATDSDDSFTQTPYSPTWHYDGLSSTSPPERGLWNEDQQDQTSPVSLRSSSPAPQTPFFLGTESARLRLHALLEEARKI